MATELPNGTIVRRTVDQMVGKIVDCALWAGDPDYTYEILMNDGSTAHRTPGELRCRFVLDHIPGVAA